ncbi:MAG: hypothetical protein CM1200mP2_09840 [Planctomycetaceae bacterium]|nr:MAG: hypothetical protein CM1200mP2_09840 [Planctomycetaceae bacterium]
MGLIPRRSRTWLTIRSCGGPSATFRSGRFCRVESIRPRRASLASAGRGDLPTFTVSFDDPRFNEGPQAAAVAAELGLPHHDIRVRLDQLPGLVDDYLDCYEQPYADTSGLRQCCCVARSGATCGWRCVEMGGTSVLVATLDTAGSVGHCLPGSGRGCFERLRGGWPAAAIVDVATGLPVGSGNGMRPACTPRSCEAGTSHHWPG